MSDTLVIGASLNETRYSNLAIKRLRQNNHNVFALGLKEGVIGDVNIETGKPPYKNIDTVTLYINPSRQPDYYDYIISLRPRRVIFNPGTENINFENLLSKNGIITLEACTLVLLSIKDY